MPLLPVKAHVPAPTLARRKILIYGAPKVGKSQWCSQAPAPIFLATESRHEHLPIFKADITNWGEFLQAAAEIKAGKHDFKTVVVDTIDNLLHQCAQHVLEKHNVTHESELPYGRGITLIRNEFRRVLTALSQLPYTLLLVSHATTKDFKTRTGEVTRIVPSIADKEMLKFVMGFTDAILYADFDADAEPDERGHLPRIVHTRPGALFVAGDGTGASLPARLPLDFKALEAVLAQTPNASAPVVSPQPVVHQAVVPPSKATAASAKPAPAQAAK